METIYKEPQHIYYRNGDSQYFTTAGGKYIRKTNKRKTKKRKMKKRKTNKRKTNKRKMNRITKRYKGGNYNINNTDENIYKGNESIVGDLLT